MSPVSASANATAQQARSARLPLFPATAAACRFIANHAIAALIVSAVVLIPCFWHRHIQATDLGSHVYNAWLAQLIHQDAAPGLHIVPQHSNVLFDLILSFFFRLAGPVVAERVAVSIAVLVFFWGGFALCSAAAENPAWTVVPLLAMACYGFMFNMGFFNLYLSVGLSLFFLAILWRGRRFDFLLLAPLFALIWTAHLLGTAGALLLGGFLLLMRFLPLRGQLGVTALAFAGYFAARFYVLHHFYILQPESDVYWMLGPDQLVTYNASYLWVALAVLIAAVVVIALALRRDGLLVLRRRSAWLQIYALMAIAVYCAPGGILHPTLQRMGYIPDRASLYSVALLCALLASLRPAKWQGIMLAVIGLAFFALLYRDTGTLNATEAKLDTVVSGLHPGDRVIANLYHPPHWRIADEHLIDRACIDHCYSFANYEASSRQFRIKADPGNPIVTASTTDSRDMELGQYIVRPEDLPITEIFSCGPALSDICVHPLQAREPNGRVYFETLQRMGLRR